MLLVLLAVLVQALDEVPFDALRAGGTRPSIYFSRLPTSHLESLSPEMRLQRRFAPRVCSGSLRAARS
jgi:hypothetical protein